MKISLFVHSLGGNPIVRAKPIADALEYMGHEVEVLGLLIDQERVYPPYADCYEYRVLRSSSYTRDVIFKARRLARMASGDVAYAFKPLATSFFPALLYTGFGRKMPLVLDVEDDDVFSKPSSLQDGIRNNLRECNKAIGYWPSRVLDRFVRNCSDVTVSSRKLSFIYGGKILLHGPSQRGVSCAVGSDQQQCLKEKYRLPTEKITLLFAGKPRIHKGFDALISAVSEPDFGELFHLALAGDPDHELFRQTKRRGGSACSLLGMIPQDEIQEIVKAADLIPVIQSDDPYAESQVPAKLLEAMACARPAIVSPVGDLPLLIDSERGWVLDEGTGFSVSKMLRGVARIGNRFEVSACLNVKGKRAEEYYLENCAPSAIAKRLCQLPSFS